MLLRQYSLVLFASTLMVTLSTRVGVAFTLIPSRPGATSYYREEVTFPLGNNLQGNTTIDKGLWFRPLPIGGTFKFKATLRKWSLTSDLGLLGWDFEPAQQPLEGSFEIVTYQACGLGDACARAGTPLNPIIAPYRGVGSLFYLKYDPADTDPQPGEGTIHWIQVVQASYGSFINGIPFVDNGSKTDAPYYDYPGFPNADETFFIDRPYAAGRSNAAKSNYFNAQLYLVQETTPPGSDKRQVTIYNGIRWGWKNSITSSGRGGGGVDNAAATRRADRELPVSEIDSGDTSQLPQAVPEPNSALGILAIGGWFGATWFSKRKKSSASLTDKPKIK